MTGVSSGQGPACPDVPHSLLDAELHHHQLVANQGFFLSFPQKHEAYGEVRGISVHASPAGCALGPLRH